MTPDPLGGDITNPQSLNRYAYVVNNPTTLVEPSGLWPKCQGCKQVARTSGVEVRGLLGIGVEMPRT